MSTFTRDPWDDLSTCNKHFTTFPRGGVCVGCVAESETPPAAEYVLRVPGEPVSSPASLANRLRALADEVEALAGPRA
jgi:hypothetical protein